MKELYRYQIQITASMNEERPLFYVHLHCRTFPITKTTEKGFWIEPKKWVSNYSKKRFAYPTKKEALNNFIKRSRRRIGFLKTAISQTQDGINIAETLLNKLK